MRYVYLHGFASAPQSRKAQAFRSALAAAGVQLEIPDLAQGNFEHLTITGQLSVIHRTCLGEPCRLIGSSLGGYLAALYASAHPEVDRAVLLAPAFNFAPRWRDLEGWRESGWLNVYHYGDKSMRRVHYGLLEDALQYPANPDFRQPAHIFHGIHDTVVPAEYSRLFAASHPNATLTEVDSGHELLDVLDRITTESVPFLLAEPPFRTV